MWICRCISPVCGRGEKGDYGIYIVGILHKLSKIRDAEGFLTSEFFPLAWKSVNQPSKTNSSMATESVALHSASVMLCFMQRYFVELGKCMDMWLLTDAKNNIDQLGSSAQPVYLDLNPLLDILKRKIVHQGVQVAHLEREFMLADELTMSRPGVLLRTLVSGSKRLVRLFELRPVVVEHYQLPSSKEYPSEEVPLGNTESDLPPETGNIEVVIAQGDGTMAQYSSPRTIGFIFQGLTGSCSTRRVRG